MMELKMNIHYKFENSIEGLNELCKLISNFIKKLTIAKDKILNINVNVSGRVNPESGYSFSQFNFEERPLSEVLAEKLGYKVTIDNDTRAMTYGEYLKGCVNGEKDIIFVNISWGLGVGIIIDGKIYTGKSGFSPENSAIPVPLTMKLFATAAKKAVSKQKLPDLRYTASCWNVYKMVKTQSYPIV